jgi:hypothetical protein
MRTYARIQNGIVAELLKTDGDITSMFNPELVWIDVSSQSAVVDGWMLDGEDFMPPEILPPPEAVLTIAQLQAQIAALAAQVAALSHPS